MKRASSHSLLVSGFTIVELLIVVVVIAILAAITIVSYNGISNRAKASAAQSTASQATKKLALYAIQNSDTYPVDKPTFLTATALTDPDGITYQYTANTSVTPNTFCLTTTTNGISYYTSNTNLTPTAGACPGHGVNGGTVVTNLASDPRATSQGYTVGVARWGNTRWFGSTGAAGTYTNVIGASDGPVGVSSYIRKTWTAINATTAGDLGFENSYGTSNTTVATGFTVTGGATYTISDYLRSSVTYSSADLGFYWHDSSGAYISQGVSSGVKLTAGVWSRISLTITAPANAATLGIVSDLDGQVAVVGMTLDGTGLMITQGSTLYNYGDPITNPSSWAWTGIPNASTSTSPQP